MSSLQGHNHHPRTLLQPSCHHISAKRRTPKLALTQPQLKAKLNPKHHTQARRRLELALARAETHCPCSEETRTWDRAPQSPTHHTVAGMEGHTSHHPFVASFGTSRGANKPAARLKSVFFLIRKKSVFFSFLKWNCGGFGAFGPVFVTLKPCDAGSQCLFGGTPIFPNCPNS